jgi:hypothetical protein
MIFLVIFAIFPVRACSISRNTDFSIASSSIASVSSSLRKRRNLESSSSYPPNYPFAYEWNTSLSSFQPKYYDLPADSRSLKPDLLTARPNERYRFHGQAQQDLTVIKILNDKEYGFFVDLAANEWRSSSNTYVLEYYNHWKGVCIEPLTQYIIPLLSNRKCQLFVNPVSEKANEIVKFRNRKGESGILGTDFTTEGAGTKNNSLEVNELDNKGAFNPKTDIELITTTFTDILDFAKAPAIIDYLSLDIEGAEYFAMKGFDFSRYTILLMSIERPSPNLHYLLIKKGYLFLFQNSDWGDCFYVHHTIPRFIEIMEEYHNPCSAKWYGKKKEYLTYPTWNRVTWVPFERVLQIQPFPQRYFKGVIHIEPEDEKEGSFTTTTMTSEVQGKEDSKKLSSADILKSEEGIIQGAGSGGRKRHKHKNKVDIFTNNRKTV